MRRAKFLNKAERDEVERRLSRDHGLLSNTFDYKFVFQAIKDWKIYIHMLICMAGFCPIYSFSLFLPTIIKNMGYTANEAQLMSVPPYVAACFFTIAASWVADRAKQRGVFMLGFQMVAIAGFALLAASGTARMQYTGTILAAIGKIAYHRQLFWCKTYTCFRYLPSNSPRSRVERQQHWRESQARHWNRDASYGW